MIDFNLSKGEPIVFKDIDFVMQQMDLLFDTTLKDVLGDESCGSHYDKYLYKLNISNDDLKQKVLSDLNSLDLRGFSPYVDVYFLEGTERDIAMIDITLSKDYENYNRTYKIS